MRRDTRPTLSERLLFITLAPPCFLAGVAIGGCGFSARDDFLQVRSAQLVAQPGDRSAFVPATTLPVVAGFSNRQVSLSSVSEMMSEP